MGTSHDHLEEKLSTDRNRVVGELVHGRDLAAQLQILLHEPYSDQRSVSAEDLVGKILRSFTNTLSVLICCDQFDLAGVGSPAESGRCKGVKNRRGCHNRRKHSETWTVISSTTEDGRVWRKYGQKEILNAKFPRSYYRCTRKHEQGCRAMKQVQRMEGDPTKYHTTYIGRHTCADILKAPQIIRGYKSNYVVGSESKIPEEVQEMKPELTIKQETGVSDLTADNVSSLDSVNIWSGLEGLECSSMSALMVPPRGGSDSDHGGPDADSTVYSRNATSCSTTTEMDFAVGCLDLINCDDQFLFDESHLQFLYV